MPNDPSIPLSVNVAVPKFNTPFEQLGQVYALRGAKLNQDLTQQEINTGKSLEDERRQKVEHGQRVQQAWQDINGLMQARGGSLPTDEEIAPAMTQAGEDPAPYLKESAEQRDRLAKLKASQLKNQEDETNLIAEAMASVAKDGYDPHHFALKVAQLKQGGIDTTLLEKSIQEHPERTKEIIDALAQSNKQQEVTDKAQAAADEHAAAPGKIPDPVTGLTPSQTATNTRELERIALEKKRIAAEAAKAVSGAGGASGLDDAGLDLAAAMYRITRNLPARNAAQNGAIISRAAAQAKSIGQTPATVIQRQFAAKADSAALQQAMKASTSVEAFETKALGQADLVESLSKKVGRTASPLLNAALLSGKSELIGDENTRLLFNAITGFTSEYAKILEGSTGSSAASSDSSRKKSEALIRAIDNPSAVSKLVSQMKYEMSLTREGWDATIAHINDRLSGGESPSATPGRATGAGPGASGSVKPDPLGIR